MAWLNRRRGFTLVELLVVISIIALLIGILIPAIGQARTTARLTIDQSNLRQHGIGAFNYAGDHQDNMPNLPPGSGGSGQGVASSGVSSRPMRNWGIKGEGIDTSVNGLAMGGAPLAHGNVWKMHSWAFGEYIVDGATGPQLMNKVFLSAFHSNRHDVWDDLARTNEDPEIPDFPSGYSVAENAEFLDSPLLKPVTADFPDLDAQGNGVWLQPTWRYTLTAVVGTHERNNKYFWGASTTQGSGGPDNTSAFTIGREWVNFRQYVKKSQYRVPTQKVMFWDPYAWTSPKGGPYNRPDQTGVCTAVMVDSSTKVINMGEECLFTGDQDDQKKISDAYLAGDYVSTHFVYMAPGDPNIGVGGNPAQFLTGIWGVETRDLGGKGADDEDD
jgi:prepilin-type N-terminal cleavage/methylation domain-containing protein